MRTDQTGPPRSYQTVKLAQGKHASPADGVCVMELASMLGGEEFSDHPRSVCPVIGAFLRVYNDRLDGRVRQDLYAYAAKVVGTRSTIEVERRRAQMCAEWARRIDARGTLTSPSREPGRLRRWCQGCRREQAARRAALACGGEIGRTDQELHELHRAALRLLDDLIAVGSCEGSELDEPLAVMGGALRAADGAADGMAAASSRLPAE